MTKEFAVNSNFQINTWFRNQKVLIILRFAIKQFIYWLRSCTAELLQSCINKLYFWDNSAERLLPGLTAAVLLRLYNIGREGLTTMAVYSSPLLLLYYYTAETTAVQHRQRGCCSIEFEVGHTNQRSRKIMYTLEYCTKRQLVGKLARSRMPYR